MVDFRTKLQVLKNDFALVLESRYKEGIMLQAHRKGLWSIVSTAHRLRAQKDITESPASAEDVFDTCWNEVLENLSGGAKIDDVRWAYCENLTKTFKGVNKLMLEIRQQDF